MNDTPLYVTNLVTSFSPIEGAFELGKALSAFIYALSIGGASEEAQGQVMGAVILETFRRHPQIADQLKAGIQIALDNADKIVANSTPYVEKD